MLTRWILQVSCHVPEPRTRWGGDACNGETGVIFTGTMLCEVVISLSMVPGRHLQGGPNLPVHPYEAMMILPLLVTSIS